MAGISVSIVAGKNQSSSSVQASGTVQHVITDKERSTFNITDSQLKDAVAKYFGKRPNDAFVRSPTPWNDLYKTYNWAEVQTVLTVQSAQILGLTSDPVIIATQQLVNSSNKTGSFTANVQDDVSESVETNWSMSTSIDVSQTISYDVQLEEIASVGGSTTISFNQQWGQGGSQSRTTTVGSSEGVSVDLDPGESVTAQLTASRGTLKVRITYIAYLTGNVAINYNPTYKGHHFWALDVGGVMQAGGISNSAVFSEDIQVGYYANAKVELIDPTSKKLRAVVRV